MGYQASIAHQFSPRDIRRKSQLYARYGVTEYIEITSSNLKRTIFRRTDADAPAGASGNWLRTHVLGVEAPLDALGPTLRLC